MRFHITLCDRDTNRAYLKEVIGDIVEVPGMPPGSCAVHALVNSDPSSPLYAVSHIASGWRVAAGDSIDFAIRMACDRAAKVDPAKRDAGLQRALTFRRRLERNTARQLPTAVPTDILSAAFAPAKPAGESK